MKKLFVTFAMLVALLAMMSVTASAALVTDNVAAGKTITCTYPEYLSPESGLNRDYTFVVDGDHTNVKDTMCIVSWTEDGYFMIDLGAQYDIAGFGLYNYMYPAQYCICSKWTWSVSADGENWSTDLRQCKLGEEPSSVGTGGYDVDNLGDKFYPKNGTSGRYVKLKIDEVYVGGTSLDHKGIRLYEIEVYGTLKAGEDKPAVDPEAQAKLDAAAAEKKAAEEREAYYKALKNVVSGVTATTNLSNVNGIERLTDGDTTQDYQHMYDVSYKTDDEKSPWIAFDFGATYKIKAYRMYNYRWAAEYGRISSWNFQVSDDGKNWTTVHTVSGLKDYTECDEFKLDKEVEARYARIDIVETIGGPKQEEPSIKVYEIGIYADPTAVKAAEPAETKTEEKKEEAKPAETKTEEKKEEAKPAETETEEKKEETAPAAAETKPAETKAEEKKEESKAETTADDKKEETKTDAAASADDTAAPAEEAKSNTGLIVGIVAAVVVLAVVLALVLKKKKK